MCITCNNRKCHVQMSGCCLKGTSNDLLKRYMIECSIIKPIHVVKKETDSFALVHFATEIDASTFYHIYCLQKKVVCPRLEGVTVNPSLIGNQPVIYSSFRVQPRIISSTRILCRCPPNNTGNANINTSTTNSNNTSADPSALTTTNSNPALSRTQIIVI
ncbi:MAG: hypothetical protein EXX96DRAFT_580166 [Benjaminiella poitrasii]|nr:MAG: hypothetical protein EXX96DRAFT_580166 [Benjaminiella poitrasii]